MQPGTETLIEPVSPHVIESSPTDRSLTADEAREFADVLGIRPEAIKPFRMGDDIGDGEDAQWDYDQLVADPIKSLVARDPGYYHDRKVGLVREWASTSFGGRDPRRLRVLDVGCGTGQLMRRLENHFDEVWGCDPSGGMVRRAGRRAVRMTVPDRIPFPANSFDIAICACVYHHVDAGERVAHALEVRRVLRENGLLMIFEHNPRNPVTRRIVGRCPIDEAASLLDLGQSRAMLRDAGYHDVSSRFYLFMPQTLYRWFGGLERLLSFTGLGGQYCAVGRNPGHSINVPR